MVDEILPDLYRIEIPLHPSPLKVLNSYVIKSDDRVLIMDTGWNRPDCAAAMAAGLKELGVDLGKADFVITHLHADHIGLVGDLVTDTSTVYFNQKEAGLVGREERRTAILDAFIANGFPEKEARVSRENHPGRKFGLKKPIDFHFLAENDGVDVGDYSFRCIETPGHSPGHLCLYEPGKKLLIAGDHILDDITPNISYWVEMGDSLRSYLASLDKVYKLDVKLVLPGHRSIMSDHRKRIEELRAHHQARLNEVIVALQEGEKNAFQVAPHITWDIACNSWEQFPIQQKWFAFGETLAHLRYLLANGTVRQVSADHQVRFALA